MYGEFSAPSRNEPMLACEPQTDSRPDRGQRSERNEMP
jgi:hypothetical protein